jgi:Domain found in Dishevelled, Egl-10, and Pleckstrin (DEP)
MKPSLIIRSVGKPEFHQTSKFNAVAVMVGTAKVACWDGLVQENKLDCTNDESKCDAGSEAGPAALPVTSGFMDGDTAECTTSIAAPPLDNFSKPAALHKTLQKLGIAASRITAATCATTTSDVLKEGTSTNPALTVEAIALAILPASDVEQGGPTPTSAEAVLHFLKDTEKQMRIACGPSGAGHFDLGNNGHWNTGNRHPQSFVGSAAIGWFVAYVASKQDKYKRTIAPTEAVTVCEAMRMAGLIVSVDLHHAFVNGNEFYRFTALTLDRYQEILEHGQESPSQLNLQMLIAAVCSALAAGVYIFPCSGWGVLLPMTWLFMLYWGMSAPISSRAPLPFNTFKINNDPAAFKRAQASAVSGDQFVVVGDKPKQLQAPQSSAGQPANNRRGSAIIAALKDPKSIAAAATKGLVEGRVGFKQRKFDYRVTFNVSGTTKGMLQYLGVYDDAVKRDTPWWLAHYLVIGLVLMIVVLPSSLYRVSHIQYPSCGKQDPYCTQYMIANSTMPDNIEHPKWEGGAVVSLRCNIYA